MRKRIREGWWSTEEEGMSLVEVMIAAFVLSVALLALASTAITSIISLRVSQARQEATDAASAMIEDLRRADYASIALASSAVPAGSCDDEYDEPIVTTDLPGAIPQVQPFGPSGRVTVTTSVSWYDEDDSDAETCDHAHRRSKRVRVVASWEDSGKSYSVEESTVVAPVDRGLPAPDFRLGTPTVTVSFTPSELGKEKCVGHAIRNLGAEDGYDWTANRTDSGSVYKPTGGSEYTTQGGKVRMRAFLEHPIADPPLDPAPHAIPSQSQRYANVPAGLQLLVDGDGNTHPETDPDAKLATGDQARLWICYLADVSLSPSTTPIATLGLTVRSQFDPNRLENVEHTLRITKEALNFHLYDDDTSADGASGPRVVTTSGNTETLPVQVMGPETSLQPRKVGTSASLPNFDTDFDSLPGLRLADGPRPAVSGDTNWAASTVAFHQQVTPGVTFEPTVRLRLFTASQSALTMTEVPAKTLQYRVRLQVLAKNERTVQSTPLDATIAYSHTAAGFEAIEPTFTMAAPLTLQNEQFLRLEITCLATSEDVCHLAYDNTAYPSRLGLVQQ